VSARDLRLYRLWTGGRGLEVLTDQSVNGGEAAASWTSWVVGVVVTASALLALPASRAVHQRQIAGHAG
jgi:hypothetical protein